MTRLDELATAIENAAGPSRGLDAQVYCAVNKHPRGCPLRAENDGRISVFVDGYWHHSYTASMNYTKSLDAVRTLGGLCVFASDIAADGLATVKIVDDTSTSPIIEYTGIASTLERAWLAAALRARATPTQIGAA